MSSKILKKFTDGESMTDEEVIELYTNLVNLDKALAPFAGEYDPFRITTYFTRIRLDQFESFMQARGLK